MTWVSLAFIPPTALVVLAWFLSLSTRRFFRAWVLSYVGQGMATIPAAVYLVGGDWIDGVSAAFLAVLFVGFRQVFTAEGLHKRFLPWGG